MESGLFCVSGTALGAALASLAVQLSRSRAKPEQTPAPPAPYPYPPPPWYGAQPSQQWAQQGVTPQLPAMYPQRSVMPANAGNSTSNAAARKGTWMPGEELEQVDVSAVTHGFSMEEAKERNALQKNKAAERTPEQCLNDLQKGNTRFWMGVAQRPEMSAFQRRALIISQFPSVAVLGCADSRVPVEIVFDQGLGDMFVVRVAGNCLDTTTTASLQYAVCHLGVKVLLVMGHEGCGAIKAAQLPEEKLDQEPADLRTALLTLKDGLDEDRLAQVQDPRARDRESVVTNVKSQLYRLTRDEYIMDKVNKKELIVVGCFYEISSGIVDFFLEITEVKESDSLANTPKHKDEITRQKSQDKLMIVKQSPMSRCASTTLEVHSGKF